MKEIKFRAWTHQDPPMPWSQKAVAITGEGEQMLPIGGTYTGVWHAFNNAADGGLIIEQYTGLKDKNGREIYEGDILRWEYRFMDGRKSTNTMIVRWNQSECCFEIHFIKGNFGDSMLDDDSCDEYEVIGNIHENPELLGGEE